MPDPRIIGPENPQSSACLAETKPTPVNRDFQIRLCVSNSSISFIRSLNAFVKT